MKKKFYKVTGIDRVNNDLYKLGYTGDKKRCSKFYVGGGWKREDLVFEEKKKSWGSRIEPKTKLKRG